MHRHWRDGGEARRDRQGVLRGGGTDDRVMSSVKQPFSEDDRPRKAMGCPTPPGVKMDAMSDEVTKDSRQDDPRMPLPPPTFAFMVLSLRAQCEVHLGLMHYGEEEKPEPDLQLARHTIDMLAMLLEKTKGDLSLEEQRMLENSLTELRFRFVQISGDVAKAPAPKD